MVAALVAGINFIARDGSSPGYSVESTAGASSSPSLQATVAWDFGSARATDLSSGHFRVRPLQWTRKIQKVDRFTASRRKSSSTPTTSISTKRCSHRCECCATMRPWARFRMKSLRNRMSRPAASPGTGPDSMARQDIGCPSKRSTAREYRKKPSPVRRVSCDWISVSSPSFATPRKAEERSITDLRLRNGRRRLHARAARGRLAAGQRRPGARRNFFRKGTRQASDKATRS